MTLIDTKTPNDLATALWDLEHAILGSWLRGPSFRERWTPDPSEGSTEQLRAVATACASIASAGAKELDLCTQLPWTLRELKLIHMWPSGQPMLNGTVSKDPDADLQTWRGLRGIIAARRSLVETLSTLTPAIDPSEFSRRVLEATSLTSISGAAKVWSDAESLSLAIEAIRAPRVSGSFTGSPKLDQHTGGVRPGHVWVLGAPTNWGKSSWLIALSERYLQVHGRGVLLISCEDEPLLFSLRRLCRRAGIRGGAARDGKISASEYESAVGALSEASSRGKAPVLLDGRGRPVEALAEDIRRMAKLNGIRLVLVDYLQCIATQRDTQDRRAEINHIGRTLTDAIKMSGCAGVLASQLTGEDIRESRDIEHAAEVVLIGRKHLASVDKDGNELSPGKKDIFIKKNKTGASGDAIDLEWDETTGSFRDVEDAYADQFTEAY